ncbi:MAG: formate/nitrite transporter family protein [Candidatus Pacebacteria bacterium]|nr:formate/nitrite transporter family protein [Candidatus Paceibacterota bacterium]
MAELEKDPVRAGHAAESQSGYDPKLSLKELAETISSLGRKKANTRLWQLFLLGFLAGIYISIGGHAFLVTLEQGMGKVVGGAVFSLGLVLVVVAGAELFTGNIIMIVGAITHLYSVQKLLRNWLIVYAGNLVGAYLFAIVIWKSGLMGGEGGLNNLGSLAERVADAKLGLGMGACVVRGILCNILVLLAIIMATMAKDITSKILCCVFPIMVFVACGFEHCVANMYLIPVGLFAKGVPFWRHGIMFGNILPVSLGNIIGGIFILVIHPNRIRQIMHLWTRKDIIRQEVRRDG